MIKYVNSRHLAHFRKKIFCETLMCARLHVVRYMKTASSGNLLSSAMSLNPQVTHTCMYSKKFEHLDMPFGEFWKPV